MNFAGGQIQKQIYGALQQDYVREAVCEVMEGGKEALDKRYFRISKAFFQYIYLNRGRIS